MAFCACSAGAEEQGNDRPAAFDQEAPYGTLSPAELDRYQRALETRNSGGPTREQLFRLAEIGEFRLEAGEDASIPVEKFSGSIPPLDQSNPAQRVFLRDSVLDAPQFGPSGLGALPNPAMFSFSKNGISNQTTLAFKGALAVPLSFSYQPAPVAGDRSKFGFDHGYFALFLEGEGKQQSGVSDEGFLRTGLKSDFVFSGGVFDALTFVTALYYQTDLDFQASGFGVKVTAVPLNAKISMGGTVNRTKPGAKDVYAFYQPRFSIDAFRANDPGTTNLAANQDYVWLGAGLDFIYVNDAFGAYGMQARLGINYNYDAIGSRDATQGYGEIKVFLDGKKTTSLSLRYDKGTKYQTLEKTDTVTFALGLKI